ncbi:hypothetical protein D6779_06985, partial [Candidatus Parcubacteria bacterium]
MPYKNHYSIWIFTSLLILGGIGKVSAFPQAQYTIPEKINVYMYALDPEGRKGEPCQQGSTDYGCGSNSHPYPHSSSIMNVNLENDYLPFVIAQEMGDNATLEALKAHAVAARSYALHTVEFSQLNNSASSGGQVFLPYSITPNANHYRAVSETRGMIVVCNNNTDCEPSRRGYPAFAEHSAGHEGNFTSAWPWNNITRHLYLARVYDPIHTYANGGHGRGLSQEGTKRWAVGVVDGNNHYPQWDFRRILAHYYTGIEFQNVPDTINGYRFNIIEIGNLTPGEVIYDNNPVKDGLVVDVQNTGTNTWQIGKDFTDSCRGGTHNLALSYHIYDENNRQPACDYSGDNPGGGKCFERTRYLMCWQNFTTLRPGEVFRLTGIKIELPPELPPGRCYNIRWDIELLNNHQERTWISRLQQPPYNKDLWPPQDTRICYAHAGSGNGNPAPPKNPGSSTHTANTWSNEANITVTWDPPPDGLVSGYQYKYEGAGATIINDGQWHSTDQTFTTFTATQDGEHLLRIRSVLNGNTSNSVEAGPYLVDRQPPFLSVGSPTGSWVTTNNFSLSWIGGDNSSGL